MLNLEEKKERTLEVFPENGSMSYPKRFSIQDTVYLFHLLVVQPTNLVLRVTSIRNI
jgi:hypothetical protein